MGMSQTGCCCGTKVGNCNTCEPTHPICCLQVENSGWSANAPILLRPAATALWDTGDTCTGINATEICGRMEVHWHFPWRYGETCLPEIFLVWRPILSDCDRIGLSLEMRQYRGVGSFYTTVVEENRSWYTRDVEFADPLYTHLHSVDPTTYPLPIPTVTIRECPEGYTAFPDPEQEVVLQSVVQEKNPTTGVWEDYEPFAPEPPLTGISCGTCVCSTRAGVGGSCVLLSWVYDPYADEVIITIGYGYCPNPFDLEGSTRVPYDSCAWPDSEIFVYVLGVSPEDDPTVRVRVQRLEIECPTGPIDPVDPPNYCKKKILCVRLTVPTEGHTDYLAYGETILYNLIWQEDTQQYELGPVAAVSRPYTIEITLVEDAGSLPTGSPAGARAWVLTVTIRDATTEAVVLEYTDVLVLDCTEAWSWEDVLEVPLDPTEDWNLRIGTSCPAPPDPPECDPGCWPDCVLCPTPLSMSIVVAQNPNCCFYGTFGLTYDSGTDTFYLPSPVGYVAGTCGGIRTFVMSCDSSSTVTFTWTFRDQDGTDHNRTDTVSASCSGGAFETAAVDVLTILGFPGLCSRGLFPARGASVRVVGI